MSKRDKEVVLLVMGTFGGWVEQTKKILHVIFELTAERDNIPYHIAANMIRAQFTITFDELDRRRSATRHNTQTAISCLISYTHSKIKKLLWRKITSGRLQLDRRRFAPQYVLWYDTLTTIIWERISKNHITSHLHITHHIPSTHHTTSTHHTSHTIYTSHHIITTIKITSHPIYTSHHIPSHLHITLHLHITPHHNHN